MKKLFLALPFLLAGCQSARVAFQFQPVAPTGGAAPVSRPAAPAAAGTLAVAAATEAVEQDRPETKPLANKPVFGNNTVAQAATMRIAAAPAALASEVPAALAPTRSHPLRSLALRRLVRQRATAGPARTAESGLGGIALFFIGVVLALLAGLGALVSVIFGTGFFTGVGFAAAGLLVLFLLYSLLSGSKKPKK